MTIESWTPNNSSIAPPNRQALLDMIRLEQENLPLDEIVSPERQREWQGFMKLPKQVWIDIGLEISTEETLSLIRFFTCAEEVFSGWQAGADSPVIGLVKSLRLRNAPPSKDLLLWIKAHSTNRFLPNGPLL